MPDLPPDSYFEHPPDHPTPPPTPLHNLNTGLLKPHYLAFLCGQALSQQEEMLKPVYQEHLTHLAAVLYVLGNFLLSTHSSNIGLFKPEVFMARALLANTAEVSSAPLKMLTNIEDPDVTE